MQALEADFYVPRLVAVPIDRRAAPSEATPGTQLLVGTVPGGSGRLTAVKLTLATPDRDELAGTAAEQAEALVASVEEAADLAMENTPEAEAVYRAEHAVTNVKSALPGAREAVREARSALAQALAAGEPPPPLTAVPDAERYLADATRLLGQYQAELEQARTAFGRRRAQVRGPVAAERRAELGERRAVLLERARAAALELGSELLAVAAAEAALNPK